MYGIDGTGRLNVSLNGKGVGQINIDQYLQVIVPKGKHQLQLQHQDLFDFSSSHEIVVDGSAAYFEVYATVTSNGVKSTQALPADFATKFQAAY